jgi:nitrogen regulatory protein P-II 2
VKLVIAYIQPGKLNDVKEALYKAQVYKISAITNALGCGQEKGSYQNVRNGDLEAGLIKKIRLEIAVNDNFVQPTIEAIMVGARTGMIGDGKIFVLDLPQCVRIRTGESGPNAIG